MRSGVKAVVEGQDADKKTNDNNATPQCNSLLERRGTVKLSKVHSHVGCALSSDMPDSQTAPIK